MCVGGGVVVVVMVMVVVVVVGVGGRSLIRIINLPALEHFRADAYYNRFTSPPTVHPGEVPRNLFSKNLIVVVVVL